MLALVIVFFALSCSDDDKNKDYGPEASETDLQSAIEKAQTNSLSRWFEKGEYVRIEQKQHINGWPSCVFRDTGFTVTDYIEHPDRYEIQLLEERVDYDLTKYYSPPNECPLMGSFQKKYLRSFARSESLSTSSSRQQRVGTQDGEKITYHNLQSTTTKLDAPDRVKQLPNCGGLPGCRMNVTKVSFDQIIHFSEDEIDIRRWEMYFSPDLPLVTIFPGWEVGLGVLDVPGPVLKSLIGTAGLLRLCTNRLFETGSGFKIQGRGCYEVIDFRYKSSTTNSIK